VGYGLYKYIKKSTQVLLAGQSGKKPAIGGKIQNTHVGYKDYAREISPKA